MVARDVVALLFVATLLITSSVILGGELVLTALFCVALILACRRMLFRREPLRASLTEQMQVDMKTLMDDWKDNNLPRNATRTNLNLNNNSSSALRNAAKLLGNTEALRPEGSSWRKPSTGYSISSYS